MSMKEKVLELLDTLPDEFSWDDLMHEIYVRQAIELGLQDSETGRVRTVEQVRQQFGLS
ncbi:MAG: hypothetical protein IPL28_27510 [Chloroflexi bacterium]|nr:hypothetical protein [Chloroflexota bacterium]